MREIKSIEDVAAEVGADLAQRLRAKGLPEQEVQRRVAETVAHRKAVDERNAALQSGPIVRGPNAPKDGTFGGKPANS